MVCSNCSHPECLDFRIRSCWNVVRVVLSRPISSHTSFFYTAADRCGLLSYRFFGSLYPRSHSVQQRSPRSARNWKRPPKTKQKNRCSSIFKQRGGLSQHGSVFHPCNMPHSQKKKVMGNQADSCLSGELELILELHYSGQQQAGEGWVEWGPWERYAVRERVEKHGLGARSARSAHQHTSESLWSRGKQVHGCLLHCAEGSRAACRYCCSPLKWTWFCKSMCTFH